MIRKPKNIGEIKRCIEQDSGLKISELGLLTKLLSLSTGWIYSARGLDAITGSGRDAISANMKRLSEKGYLNYAGADVDLTPLEQIYELAENPPDSIEVVAENPPAESNYGGKSAIVAENPPAEVAENPPYKLDQDNNYIIDDDDARVRAYTREETNQAHLDQVRLTRESIRADRILAENPDDAEIIETIVEIIARAMESADSDCIRVHANADPIPAKDVKKAYRELGQNNVKTVLRRYRHAAGVKNPNVYLRAMLYNAGSAEYRRMDREKYAPKSKKPRKVNAFNNFEQRTYDYDALERQFEDQLIAANERRQPAAVSG